MAEPSAATSILLQLPLWLGLASSLLAILSLPMLTHMTKLQSPGLWRAGGLAYVAAYGMAYFGLALLVFKTIVGKPLPDFILQVMTCLTGIFFASKAFGRMKETIV
jgi:hypothetical protein